MQLKFFIEDKCITCEHLYRKSVFEQQARVIIRSSIIKYHNKCEMQTASSKIWTQVIMSISYNNSYSTMCHITVSLKLIHAILSEQIFFQQAWSANWLFSESPDKILAVPFRADLFSTGLKCKLTFHWKPR